MNWITKPKFQDLQELALQLCEAVAEVKANGFRVGGAGVVDMALYSKAFQHLWQQFRIQNTGPALSCAQAEGIRPVVQYFAT